MSFLFFFCILFWNDGKVRGPLFWGSVIIRGRGSTPALSGNWLSLCSGFLAQHFLLAEREL